MPRDVSLSDSKCWNLVAKFLCSYPGVIFSSSRSVQLLIKMRKSDTRLYGTLVFEGKACQHCLGYISCLCAVQILYSKIGPFIFFRS